MRLPLLVLLAASALAAPSAELTRLQRILDQELDALRSGTLTRQEYDVFAAAFRKNLDAGLRGAPQTSENKVLHAFILSRVNDAGRGEALAILDAMEAQNPGDPTPVKTRGRILLDAGDFRNAQAAAESVLKGNADRGEPPDQEAVRLLHFSKGRSGPVPAPGAAALSPASPAGASAPRTYTGPYSPKSSYSAKPADVPAIENESPRGSGTSMSRRIMAYTKDKIDRTQQGTVKFIDKTFGLRSGEEGAALKGAKYGAVVGAGLGVGVGVVAMGPCGPGAVLGVSYPVCVGAAGMAGIAVLTPSVAYLGGVATVSYDRFKKYVTENGGPSIEPERSEQ